MRLKSKKTFYLAVLLYSFFLNPIAHATGEGEGESSDLAQVTIPKSVPLPGAVLFPWHFVGIPPEISEPATRQLRKDSQSLFQPLLSQPPKPFIDWHRSNLQKDLSQNLTMALSDIFVSEQNFSPNRPLAFEPVVCSMNSAFVIHLLVFDPLTDILIAAAQKTFQLSTPPSSIAARGQPNRNSKGQDDLTLLVAQFKNTSRTLISQLSANLPSALNAQRSAAMHLRLALADENSNPDRGSSQCLNLLFAENLLNSASNTTVMRPVGNESLASVFNALSFKEAVGVKPAFKRNSRTLINYWHLESLSSQAKRQPKPAFPSSFTLESRFVDAVFGQPLDKLPASIFSWNVNTEQTLITNAPETIVAAINDEAKTLAANDLPQIAYIRGAWAYLDRGRAYGLQMEDRLQSNEDGGAVKGHVVGYFGPELNLKSPRGYAIKEGAIVFVRNGQKNVKVGQTFTYDDKTYPAAH